VRDFHAAGGLGVAECDWQLRKPLRADNRRKIMCQNCGTRAKRRTTGTAPRAIATSSPASAARKGLTGQVRRGITRRYWRDFVMAKSNVVQIKLISTADTGYFYVTKKNARAQTTKLELNKYDPVVRKHVKFKEAKIK